MERSQDLAQEKGPALPRINRPQCATALAARMETAGAVGGMSSPSTRSQRLISVGPEAPLSTELAQAWQAALIRQRDSGGFASPFLGPTFASTLASVRSDVQVIVGFDGEEPTQFLPVHVSGRGRARPLAGRFCDVHGPVGVSDPEEFHELLVGAGLSSWSFRRCADRTALDASHVFVEAVSHVVRTDLGLEGLRSGGILSSTRQLKQALRKERKLAKEVGPLRFEYDHQSPEILAQLLRWKAAQRERSGSKNVLEARWATETLSQLQVAADRDAAETADAQGRMSVLWAGDHVVAAHFGLADERRLHWWIPAYAPEFASYSPGLSMLLHLVRECHARGIDAVDLGHGDERYKLGFATDLIPLYSGAVDRSRARLALGSASYRFRDSVRQSPLEPGWVATKRLLRRARSLSRRR